MRAALNVTALPGPLRGLHLEGSPQYKPGTRRQGRRQMGEAAPGSAPLMRQRRACKEGRGAGGTG